MRFLEEVLLDTMFDIPSTAGVKKIVVDQGVIKGESVPIVIYENSKSR